MPWDQNHPRVFEVHKSSHRLSSSAFRSGCYKRAITILQNESGDYAGRDATAASLYRLLTNANRKLASQTSAALSNAGQREIAPSQNQNPSAQEKQKQDKLQVTVIKEQLRRERQEQRHEQNKQLWQRRQEEKVRLRQQELAARVRQQEEARNEQLHKLKQQQQKLEQQLEEHKQSSASLTCADPVAIVSNISAAPQKQLLEVQQFKSKAEVQLALACQAGEHMSRRAASIEPEDGECTPSPSAMQQAKTAAKHGHQLSVPVEQALPPPPPANLRPAGRTQTKDSYGRSTTGGQSAHSVQHFTDHALPPPPPLP
ncbi:hypothetical protein WJX77_007887 [Trebouxia sp. C0004]